MFFMRRGVGNINGVVIKLPVVKSSMLESFNPLKLHGELLYLLLKSNNRIIPPYFMSLFKRQAPRLRVFPIIGHCWMRSRVERRLRLRGKNSTGHAGRDTSGRIGSNGHV